MSLPPQSFNPEKSLCFLVKHAPPTAFGSSLIWLHDGVWVSPLPSPTVLLAANRAASTSHLGLEAPLVLQTTELAQAAQSAEAELLAGRPPPSGDPPPILLAPRPSVMPLLSEPRAQAAFLRMMARAARSGSHSQDVTDIINLDPQPKQQRGKKKQHSILFL